MKTVPYYFVPTGYAFISMQPDSPYYTTNTGRRVYYTDIARAIDTLHPSKRGKHIFQQLEVLGLYGEFRRGDTPCSLPYSFSDYLQENQTCSTETESCTSTS